MLGSSRHQSLSQQCLTNNSIQASDHLNSAKHHHKLSRSSSDRSSLSLGPLEGSVCQEQYRVMSDWFSLAAYLNVRFLGGALSMLKPKRRYYFVLDEINCQLVYFKDENEFIRRKDAIGQICLKQCAVTLSVNNPAIFIIRCAGNRQYELEAANEKSAGVWLNSLQNREESSSKQSGGGLQAQALGSTELAQSQGLSRRLSSTSLPSYAEMCDALDSALDAANHQSPSSPHASNRQQRDSHQLHKDSFRSKCKFYFSTTPDDQMSQVMAIDDAKSSVTSAQDVMCSSFPPPDPFVHNHGPGTNESPNADALQHWISNWLHQQPNTYEDQGSDTETDLAAANNERFAAGGPVSRDDLHTELANLRCELQRSREREAEQRQQVLAMNRRMQLLQAKQDTLSDAGTPPVSPSDAHTKQLQNQNKFLNAEVVRLSTKMHDETNQAGVLMRRVAEVECQLEQLKQQYVYLLQSCIRVPVSDRRPIDAVEVKLFGGDVHKRRVCELLDQARERDPTLPTYESVSCGNHHVDIYGFRHSFSEESLGLHYMCTQLHLHYQAQAAQHQQHKQRWKLYLDKNKNILVNNQETRVLVRQGIPASYRSAVWRCLIHQQVVDFKLKFGKYYFRNLCSCKGKADYEYAQVHQKQITLDLLRSMPNNVHFTSPTSKGVNQLQQVLRAFCLHNPVIGYCQGMNFVAAVSLLFLSTEDTFWFLVALTDRYFVPSYFDSSLTGAQADQEVLKELVQEKLPQLAEHLDKCDIDLATVTLNWFLPLFFDAVPFQTMLRVWDCFLLEGPKTLFRVSLALLCLNETTILERHDTISVMKILKGAAKLTYDVEGIMQVAFEGMKPFPKRRELIAKQTMYLKELKDRLRQKRQLRAAISTAADVTDQVPDSPSCVQSLPLHCCTFDAAANTAILAYGNQNCGKLALVSLSTGQMSQQTLEFDCRIVSLLYAEQVQMGYLSLVSGYLVAFTSSRDACRRSWELKVTDTILHMVFHEKRLYASLANGSLAVFENCWSTSPNALELYYIPIGPAPLTHLAAALNSQHLWVAMGNKCIVLNINTLDCVEQVYVAGNVTGGAVSFFEQILSLQATDDGIWLVTAHSPLVQLWDCSTFTCRLLFDISTDHNSTSRAYMNDKEQDKQTHITCLLCHDHELWVGTADGYLLVYSMQRKTYPGLTASGLRTPTNTTVTRGDVSRSVSTGSSGQPITAQSMWSSGYGSHNGDTHLAPVGHEPCKVSGGAGCPRQSVVRTRLARRRAGISRTRSSATMTNMQYKRNRNRTISGSHFTLSPTFPDSEGRAETDFKLEVERSASLAYNKWSSMHDLGAFGSVRKSSGSSLLQRLRSATSFSSVQCTDDEALEADPLMNEDGSRASRASGGLCSTSLARSESVWKLQSQTLPLEVGAGGSGKSPGSKGSPTESDITSYTAHAESVTLRRKDLQFDNSMSQLSQGRVSPDVHDSGSALGMSDTCSVLSIGSTLDPPFAFALNMTMKLKISDQAINSVQCSRPGHKDAVIISCAGAYSDQEAVLLWTRETSSGLWLNNPVVDSSVPVKKTPPLAKAAKKNGSSV